MAQVFQRSTASAAPGTPTAITATTTTITNVSLRDFASYSIVAEEIIDTGSIRSTSLSARLSITAIIVPKSSFVEHLLDFDIGLWVVALGAGSFFG